MNPHSTAKVIDTYTYGDDEVAPTQVPNPADLCKQMADLNRRAKQEREQLEARMELLRRVVNITDSALHADDTPEASSEPFGCSF